MGDTWNLKLGDNFYQVTYQKETIIINGTAYPVKQFQQKRVGSIFAPEMVYYIALEGRWVELHVPPDGGCVMVANGRDCLTGEVHLPTKTPWWAWLFAALYIVNYLFLRGAIGAGAAFFGFFQTLQLASNPRVPAKKRALSCLVLWLIVTAIELALAVLVGVFAGVALTLFAD